MAGKIIIDVLTLDAAQCAACQYMLESVEDLPPDVKNSIEYKEWNIKSKEGIGKFLELKGRVLPTIVINGEKCFESIIPTVDELIAAVKRKAAEAGVAIV
jgi:uroporphyrinogen decarboxylase